MTNVRPRNVTIPLANEPLGHVDGKPVFPSTAWGEFFDGVWSRTGKYNDEGFDDSASISSIEARIESVADALEALIASLGADDGSLAELEDLRRRINALQSTQTASLSNVDAQIAEVRDQLGTFGSLVGGEEFAPIGGTGNLAFQDEVNRQLVAGGFALIETDSGAPTPTRERFYVDSDNGTQWYDNGTVVRRTNTEVLAGNATADTYDDTYPAVVAKVYFPSVSLSDEALFLILETEYTDSDAAATDAAVQAQWSIYAIVSASDNIAIKSDASSAGTARVQIWQGATAGLTFSSGGGGIVTQNANDLQSARADSSTAARYYFGTDASTFDGENVTLALCLDITSAPTGADGVSLSADTTFTARLAS